MCSLSIGSEQVGIGDCGEVVGAGHEQAALLDEVVDQCASRSSRPRRGSFVGCRHRCEESCASSSVDGGFITAVPARSIERCARVAPLTSFHAVPEPERSSDDGPADQTVDHPVLAEVHQLVSMITGNTSTAAFSHRGRSHGRKKAGTINANAREATAWPPPRCPSRASSSNCACSG